MEYYSLNQYLRDTFGCKVYKIALDAGCSCPNRDGTIGTRGCIFCSPSGSGDFAQHIDQRKLLERCRRTGIMSDRDKKILEEILLQQLEAGKERIRHKNKGGKYLAYFQAYTNTYGPVCYLETLFQKAAEQEDVVAVSIATRPDCLSEEILEMLSRIQRYKPVWVELGLQTIHEDTARLIRRGYERDVYDGAVRALKERGIQVITHVILGLPGETQEMMKETVSYVGNSGSDGIKLQLLHILQGTDLEKEYEAGNCPVMTMEEYVRLVADCLECLPKDMVIHRMTGDGDKKILLAPLWSSDKKRVWNALQKEIAKR